MVKKKKIGLVLSGGGARGFAHLGVVKALYEKGIYPEVFSGTSAGALVGAFLANGKDPDDIFSFFKGRRIFDITRIRLPKNGLLNLERIRNEIDKELKIKDIKEIKKTFFVCVSNMTKGRVEYLDKGNAVDLLVASASIPVLFSPVMISGDLYSDGGVFDNLPVEPLKDKCDLVIGVHVNPIHPVNELNNILQMASRTFTLTVNNNVKYNREICDIWIEPKELDKFEILEFNKADEIFETGYKYAKKMKIKI